MKKSVGLMGGLGNQLFQLAFAMRIPSASPVELVPVLRNVRRNSLGEPELESLVLPKHVSITNEERDLGPIATRLMSYGLRVTSSNQNPKTVAIASRMASLSHYFWEDEVKFTQGLSSGDFLYSSKHNVFHLGYFQTKQFSEDKGTFDDLMTLRPKHESKLLVDLVSNAVKEGAIMLHVRLTDYLSSPGFGIPSKEYYESGIRQVFERVGERPVWVFSDDIKMAKEFLPADFLKFFHFVNPLSDAVLNWELMRFFQGYVIANSSFSWWAAHLRKVRNAPVVMPWPWFTEGGHTKRDLTPSGWISLSKNAGFLI